MKKTYQFKMIGITFLFLIICACNEGSVDDETEGYVTSQEITTDDLEYLIRYLASDSLKGRACWSEEDLIATEFIKEQFEKMNLVGLCDSGFQNFSFYGNRYQKDCSLSFADFEGLKNRDFVPAIYGDSNAVSAEIVFVGKGFTTSSKGQKIPNFNGMDVKGKWVMFYDNLDSKEKWPFQSLYTRLEHAEKKGALGVLSIEIDTASGGILVPSKSSRMVGSTSVPVIRISENMADSIFGNINLTSKKVLDSLLVNEKLGFDIPLKLNVFLKTSRDSIYTRNVTYCLKGADTINDRYIVVGAHFDHIGSRDEFTVRGDTLIIYNGADDNASGVAGMIELAEKLSKDQTKKFKKNIVFTAFGAEESGLKGSYYYADHLPFPIDNIDLMINLDMIGRMDTLSNLAVNTAKVNEELNKILKELDELDTTLQLGIVQARQGTDYRAFHNKGVPVASFCTGMHIQYHTPNDTAGLINFEGEKKILDFVYKLIVEQADTH